MKRELRILVPMATLTTMIALAAAGSSSFAADDQWVLLDEDPSTSSYYYDTSTIVQGDDELVTVQTKAVYTTEGKADALDTIGHPKGFEDLAVTNFNYTINCSGDMSRLEKVVHRDSKGRTIKEYVLTGKAPWEQIEADTRMSLLRDAVCD
ncbi:surface-adhesin E family protein [Geobacter hydrogenophilus]|uniref:Surface-adhesin protein E-like domain-containing protein n=1 Tax=Geobacter hydrogenophilus TaxID=40983 RepID=A0A9W6FYF8_9BACT|nr:surface-adhesin E family protein [Geobacter hydrogenophilus]GLI37134.1 hypothetical protein GHYDROH2_06350 [Geobacter hydrogenophilus]